MTNQNDKIDFIDDPSIKSSRVVILISFVFGVALAMVLFIRYVLL